MSEDLYMQRCLELASGGLGLTSPNPLVGCVIVSGNRIIGEGYHHRYGGDHAEVVAINSVRDKDLFRSSTLFVNLEPCSHHGNTPPCTDLIIANNIPEVVVGVGDPNPLVNGRGVGKLRKAGVAVRTGLLKQQSIHINRRFFRFHQKKRPYIILKWAESSDGYLDISRAEGERPVINWITDSKLRMLVHRWRNEEDAILVGSGTVINDDPELTNREWPGKNPLRIVLDSDGRLKDTGWKVFSDSSPTWLYTPNEIKAKGRNIIHKADKANDEIVYQLLNDLWENNIQSMIVEGGRQVLGSFINAGLWDEARIFTGTVKFGTGVPAPAIEGFELWSGRIGGDLLKICYRCKPGVSL